jgi:hypothetical protein
MDGKQINQDSQKDQVNEKTREAVVAALPCILRELCRQNDPLPESMRPVTAFNSAQVPGIPLINYIERISKWSTCSGEAFFLALVYIDRMIKCNPAFLVTSLNVHRLALTGIMLAAKYFDDQHLNNHAYSKIGGISPQELNDLEVEFLFLVGFDLSVTPSTYERYYNELSKFVQNGRCCALSHPQFPVLVLDDEATQPATPQERLPAPIVQVTSNSSGLTQALAEAKVGAAAQSVSPAPVNSDGKEYFREEEDMILSPLPSSHTLVDSGMDIKIDEYSSTLASHASSCPLPIVHGRVYHSKKSQSSSFSRLAGSFRSLSPSPTQASCHVPRPAQRSRTIS